MLTDERLCETSNMHTYQLFKGCGVSKVDRPTLCERSGCIHTVWGSSFVLSSLADQQTGLFTIHGQPNHAPWSPAGWLPHTVAEWQVRPRWCLHGAYIQRVPASRTKHAVT